MVTPSFNYASQDDCCADWFEEDDAGNQRSYDDGSWGVDETLYTTAIDPSKFTPEQIARAEELARQIQRDSVTRKVGGQPPPPRQPTATGLDPSVEQLGSAEDALALLQRRNQQQQQQPGGYGQSVHQPPPPQQAPPQQQYVTPAHKQREQETLLVTWLQQEMQRVVGLIGSSGDPTPGQARNLLTTYANAVTTTIPFSPPEVKVAVVSAFREAHWDVPQRRPMAGSQPPEGRAICNLIFALGTFFSPRVGKQPPPPGLVDKRLAEAKAARQAAAGPPWQQTQQHQPPPQYAAANGAGRGYARGGSARPPSAGAPVGSYGRGAGGAARGGQQGGERRGGDSARHFGRGGGRGGETAYRREGTRGGRGGYDRNQGGRGGGRGEGRGEGRGGGGGQRGGGGRGGGRT